LRVLQKKLKKYGGRRKELRSTSNKGKVKTKREKFLLLKGKKRLQGNPALKDEGV